MEVVDVCQVYCGLSGRQGSRQTWLDLYLSADWRGNTQPKSIAASDPLHIHNMVCARAALLIDINLMLLSLCSATVGQKKHQA